MKNTLTLAAVSALLLTSSALGQGDPDVVAKIIDEGKNNNQVWDHLLYLSENIGTRLTGSTRLETANKWTRDKFAEWGLSNCHLFEWGTVPVRFDRGPSHMRMLSPLGKPLAFTTRAWTAGTDGPVKGIVLNEPKTEEELDAIRDQLKGAWILAPSRGRGRGFGRRNDNNTPPADEATLSREELREVLKEAGIAGTITGARSDLIITSGGWRNLDEDNLPTDVSVQIMKSDYDDIKARIDAGEDVEIEINADNKFSVGPFPLYNTIAEIPGTDLADEIIIISGHLDSWDGPGSKAAQDNGTGISVTLEAARLLMAANARPRRTIRFILWTGEEQGLLGSRAYVETLSDEEKAKISVVLVDDGGTNYEGGLVCIESMKDMLTEATAPITEAFPDMPVKIRVRDKMPRGGGSDHASFNAVGVPGFFWDESGSGGREGKNYRFIHHTQNDIPRYAVPEYLVQSATCAAVTAYNLACADTLLPRQLKEEVVVAEEKPKTVDATFKVIEGAASGVWKAYIIREDGTKSEEPLITITLELAEDGRVRGGTESRYGNSEVSSGTFDKSTGDLKFSAVSESGNTVEYTVKIANNKMVGTLSIGSRGEMEFEAVHEDKNDD